MFPTPLNTPFPSIVRVPVLSRPNSTRTPYTISESISYGPSRVTRGKNMFEQGHVAQIVLDPDNNFLSIVSNYEECVVNQPNYILNSQSRSGRNLIFHFVNWVFCCEYSTCTCEDYVVGMVCKHIYAVLHFRSAHRDYLASSGNLEEFRQIRKEALLPPQYEEGGEEYQYRTLFAENDRYVEGEDPNQLYELEQVDSKEQLTSWRQEYGDQTYQREKAALRRDVSQDNHYAVSREDADTFEANINYEQERWQSARNRFDSRRGNIQGLINN
jgi:hypothetical protein